MKHHITDLPTSSQTCQLHALWGSYWRCSYLETPNMQLIWASGARIKLWLRLMPSVQGRLVHPGQPSVRKSTNMFMSKLFWFPNTSKSALKSRHRGRGIGSTHGGCHAHLLGLAAVVWYDIQQHPNTPRRHGACANSSREIAPLPSLSILLNKSPPTSGKFHCVSKSSHPSSPNHGQAPHIWPF